MASATAIQSGHVHGDPVLELAGLTKSYGSTRVIDDLSLHVERGEIFGILGTNGAGKTTSVECAQGIRRADGGTVRVLGCDPIHDRAALRGRVGSQLQDSHLPDRLRVSEAMHLFANSSAHAQSGMRAWELEDIAKVPFAGLSGGQRQRLFLALALLNDPEIVFLDELTQGLDPNARRSVWKLIEQVRDRGTTVVLVTHFMEEAEVLCDRVAVMTAGRLVALGTPNELVERHSHGVRVRYEGQAEDAAWLEQLPGVVSARVIGSDIEVVGPSTIIAYIGSELVARGRAPVGMRVDQPDLEAALLTIIDPTGTGQ